MSIKKIVLSITLCFLVCLFGYSEIAYHSIPDNKIKAECIYYGQIQKFSNYGEVNRIEVIKSTSDYKEIKRKKLKPSSGEYWICIGKASHYSSELIINYAKNNNYDLITEEGSIQEASNKELTPINLTKNVIGTIK